MEILKKVSDILKKVAGIVTILAILSETIKFFISRVDEELGKETKEVENNETV